MGGLLAHDDRCRAPLHQSMSLYTMIHLHHVHLFSRDLTAAIAWYKRALGAEVCYDGNFGGSRNVFMKIGSGRIHL
jgi:catechol-2,3-dioxygenase